MGIFDKIKSNFSEDKHDLESALKKYQSPRKQEFILAIKEEQPTPWMKWQAVLEYAPKKSFESDLDFLVNVPTLQEILKDKTIMQSWLWEKINPQPLDSIFQTEQVKEMLHGVLQNDFDIQSGWILQKINGRIDEDCTYSESSYLLTTNNFLIYLSNYQEILH